MKKPSQIQVTTDYKQFNLIASNRGLKERDVKKLKWSIVDYKNFLHLFPIIVNKKMEVIEGQHRLRVASDNNLPIYYIIDDTITKSDISIVNNNRKAWTTDDYIWHYAEEGSMDFKRLRKLLARHKKLTRIAAVRLMDGSVVSFASGGHMTAKLRAGEINSSNYALAEIICTVSENLLESGVEYAFNGFFLLDIKNAIIQSGMAMQQAADAIAIKSGLLPNKVTPEDPLLAQQQLSKLKDFLGITSKRAYSSKEQVEKFLESHDGKKREFKLND